MSRAPAHSSLPVAWPKGCRALFDNNTCREITNLLTISITASHDDYIIFKYLTAHRIHFSTFILPDVKFETYVYATALSNILDMHYNYASYLIYKVSSESKLSYVWALCSSSFRNVWHSSELLVWMILPLDL